MDFWHRYDENFILTPSKNQVSTQAAQPKEEQKNQELSSTQATTFIAHLEDHQIPSNLESQARFTDSCVSHHLTPDSFYL